MQKDTKLFIQYFIFYFILGIVINNFHVIKTYFSTSYEQFQLIQNIYKLEEHHQINKFYYNEYIKRPDKYMNTAMNYKSKYINLKPTCMEFINNSKINSFNKTSETPKISENNDTFGNVIVSLTKLEYMLMTSIDLFELKIKMDSLILKNNKNLYEKLFISDDDLQTYEKLDKSFNKLFEKIELHFKWLTKTCNNKYTFSPSSYPNKPYLLKNNINHDIEINGKKYYHEIEFDSADGFIKQHNMNGHSDENIDEM